MIFESDTATVPIIFPQAEALLCLKNDVTASDLYHLGALAARVAENCAEGES
jgi:hypothetical protein